MTTTTDYPTTAQVEAVRQAIMGQYDPAYFDAAQPGGAMYPEPTVIEDYTSGGYPAVVWEEGPEDWPFVIAGGTTEAEHAMYAEASAEFGVSVSPKPRPAAAIPPGIFVEPVDHISVGIYPA